MALKSAVEARRISEILHFTTSNGLLGILTTGKLLSHSELPKENQLAHILQINCSDRSRDIGWHSFVNLSISRVNGSFFSIARNKWHSTKDLFWCVLSFDPEIMTHPGVLFATTNNAYLLAERAPNIEGFEALFGPSVRQFPTKWATRSKATLPHHTTCNQAEVLYPLAVPIEYLRRVYVMSRDNFHEVEAQIEVCAPQIAGKFQIVVAPEHFT